MLKNNPKAAASFRILVAGYLIYLGGHNLLSPGAVGRSLLIIASSIFFIGTGVGYALFAYKVYKNSARESEDTNASIAEKSEDTNGPFSEEVSISSAEEPEAALPTEEMDGDS
ncbi:MAG: hypothetical protein Q4A32_02110 [Lachnospiraceae bacterium]|nr:hypothetical protein [Lachnospiraceae bacterium]